MTFLILFIWSSVLSAETIIDLGVVGFANNITKSFSANLRLSDNVVRSPEPYYKIKSNLNLSPNRGNQDKQPQTTIFKLEKKTGGHKKTILIFSALDPASAQKTQGSKIDYGVCVEYNSLDDIIIFREKTGVTYPIQLADAELVKFLKITTLPALVLIEGDRVEVTTGF